MARHDRTVTALAIAAAAASVILTAAAFWLSYQHLHDVSAAHGLQNSIPRAWAWPATVDLFIMVGELLILRASLAGRIDRWAIILTVLGSATSIALNVAGVGLDAPALDQVVAAVPPVAALLAFGAIMRQIHEYITREQPVSIPDAPADQPIDAPSIYLVPPVEQADAPTEQPKAEDLLTTAQVMQRTGVSRATLTRWKNNGRLTPAATDPDTRSNLYRAEQLAWISEAAQ